MFEKSICIFHLFYLAPKLLSLTNFDEETKNVSRVMYFKSWCREKNIRKLTGITKNKTTICNG